MSGTTALRNSRFEVVGWIETDDNGHQRLLSADFYVLGHYYPDRDETVDAHLYCVGSGNLLATLLPSTR